MTKVEIAALAEHWQAKADRAMARYQESGLARHNREREQAEDLAEALRIAANAADDHSELISLRGGGLLSGRQGQRGRRCTGRSRPGQRP